MYPPVNNWSPILVPIRTIPDVACVSMSGSSSAPGPYHREHSPIPIMQVHTRLQHRYYTLRVYCTRMTMSIRWLPVGRCRPGQK